MRLRRHPPPANPNPPGGAEDLAALAWSERRYREIAEQAFELLMIVDDARTVRWANRAFERVLGFASEDIVGHDFLEFVEEQDRIGLLDTIMALRVGPASARGTADFHVRDAGGSWHWMETCATDMSNDPTIGGFVVALRDATERIAVQRELEASEERYKTLVERAQDGIYTAELDGTLTSVNGGAERLTGYSREQLVGMSVFDLIAPEDRQRAQALVERSSDGHDETAELQLVASDGRRVFIEVRGRTVAANGGSAHIEGIVRDTTERHRLESELRREATHDALTDLPNRTLFFDRLNQALARATRGNEDVAVMLLDVDDFKLINDTLGHRSGDELLVELARRLRGLLRAGETVARLGGDEFALVAEEMDSDAAVKSLAQRVVSVFLEPFSIAGSRRRLTGSLGVAVGGAGVRPTDMLRDADTALYRAKATEKGGFATFDSELRKALLKREALGRALEEALSRGAITVHYQPIVSLASGEIIAVEALVRWHHRLWGWVPPSELVPLAEERGLIVSLGREVLQSASAALRDWRAAYPGALPAGLSINVSGRELARADFSGWVADTLAERGLRPQDLALELTETALAGERRAGFDANLAALTELGIGLIVDDFGTGRSSLAALRSCPLTAVKIDGCFVREITALGDPAPITRAIVGLGSALGLTVIAEGVETAVQREYLRTLGCDAAQGYLFAPPLPAREISALLAEVTPLAVEPRATARG